MRMQWTLARLRAALPLGVPAPAALLLPALIAVLQAGVALGAEEKHGDVSIHIVTKGHDAHWAGIEGDDVLFLWLSKGGTLFFDTDGRVVSDEALPNLLKPSPPSTKTRYIRVTLESDSLPFGALVKAMERLKKAAPLDTATVIFISPDP